MVTRLALAVLAAMAIVSGPAAAAPLEAYGRLPSIEEVELSPDGKQIAFVTQVNEERKLVITGLEALGKSGRVMGLGNQKLRDIQWAGDRHLVVTTSTTTLLTGLWGPRQEFFISQLLEVASGKSRVVASNDPMSLNIVANLPEVRTVAGRRTLFFEGWRMDRRGLRTLSKMDVDTGRVATVVKGYESTRGWAIDAAGQPVAEANYYEKEKVWGLKVLRDGRWVQAQTVAAPLDPPYLVGLGRTPGTVLVNRLGDDEGELREMSVTDGAWQDALPGTITNLLYDPVTLVPVGGLKRSERRSYGFYAPADQAVWDKVARAFKGADIQLVSWSDDRKKIILLVGGPSFGVTYYVVDLNTFKADPLGDLYADIVPRDVAKVQTVSYRAADGLPIVGYLTLPPGRDAKGLPLVVLPHGGPSAHDEPGFDWWSQALAAKGYAVLQPQFRGSTGFGLAFARAGHGQWGKKMQSDLSDGVRYLSGQGVIDPKRTCIVGASYGGYAALAGVTLEKGVYRCAVAVSGPADLTRMLQWTRTLQGKGNDTLMLRNWARYLGVEGIGDPNLDLLSPAKLATDASAPVLLIHGRDDTVVPFEQSQIMASALRAAGKPVQLVALGKEDHWLSRSETRLQMLTETVKFLEANNPPD